ncbi:hypothetical protein ACIRLA_03190 [Streptomyces sp. NPDC102364]|uniref:RraA family protein n=1 Tax=Streptomyces sp. NPDC102364 TaxID=3366161 RepID=UPI00382D74BD
MGVLKSGPRACVDGVVIDRTLVDGRADHPLHALLHEPGDGAVVVVDGGASLRTALLGDLMAARAPRRRASPFGRP